MVQTAQSGKHAALLDFLGVGFENYTYESAWHALWDDRSVPAGTFNERMLAWINDVLNTSFSNLPRAMQAFAEDQGFYNWDSMTTFVLGGPGTGSAGSIYWWLPFWREA